MTNKSSAYKVLPIIIAILYITVLVFCWNRLHYGVDKTDEAFYVAEAYIVSNGAIPFVNNWVQTPGTTLLYWPLVKLFTVISGGTEGIYLFMRQAFLIFKLLVAGVLIILFKREYPLFLSFLLPLPYLSFAFFSINNFSYNNLSLSLLLISCVLLFFSLQDNEKYSRQFSFVAGILMALTILAHLSQLFTTIYVLVLFVIFERKRFKSFCRSFWFAIGGVLIALLVIAYLSVLSGGIKPILDGITIILQQPYFHIKGVGLNHNLEILRATLTLFKNFFIMGCVFFFCSIFVSYILRKKFKVDIKTIFIITLLFTQILNTIYICCNSSYRNIPLNLNICHVYILLLLLFASGWRKHLSLALFVFSPFLCFFLLNIGLNFNGIGSRGYILFTSVMLSIILTYLSLESVIIHKFTNGHKSTVLYIAMIILTATFCAACIISYYGYVYEDGPYSTLTYKMERGVYKGLYTQEERGKALIHLEDEIQKVTDENHTVLFMDLAPQAYLMARAAHFTPSTWDILLYSYVYRDKFEEGFDSKSDLPLQEYFRSVGSEPNKIIYVLDKERLKHVSLWDNDYKFTQYVKQNYIQIYTDDADRFAIIVFERNH